jgi:hypothetical protein
VNAIKHLEVLPDNESPGLGALTDFGIALGKETKAFGDSNNVLPQLLCRRRIVNRDHSHDFFKVTQEGVLENYLEVHSRS